ncbi:nitrilase-related carbon-nitrogen hydrolase [Paraburkholderia humisilvae]|uniref:CN hydrolase domain-containing protein n=1 Tax=Paraburkholderia humisilvae TaxID=627669 RepID=A0A6J5ES10_9BURK|nr:nitrilase-related carbon-nitrogen hydrolase [Paraburkholderia humisilvae]CAB3768201.1 hypothetical protein LMG29542_05805 [Paraburkholderia humisilvae]
MKPSSIAPLRIAAVPFASRRGDTRDNVTRIVAALDHAARAGIALAVFPEACLTGMGGGTRLRHADWQAIAQPLDGPLIGEVAQAVKRTGVAAGVGWIERAADGRFFNSYVVCMPGGARFCHRKLHAGGHRIDDGSRFTVFDTQWGVRAAILIGADNGLVENARVIALMGATLLLAPHCSAPRSALRGTHEAREASGEQGEGTDFGAIEALRRAMPGRALDNGTFIVLAAGTDDDSDDAGARGAALIVDPRGNVLADSGDRPQPFISADIDRSLARARVVQLWRASRRPALYRPLTASATPEELAPPEPKGVTARGAVPISFAVVKRRVKPQSGSES